MYQFESFPLFPNAIDQMVRYASFFPTACILNSNSYSEKYSKYPFVAAFGVQEQIWIENQQAFPLLMEFHDTHREWMFGFFSYDLKNQLENLNSNNPDRIGLPLSHFFIPQILILPGKDELRIGIHQNAWGIPSHQEIYQLIQEQKANPSQEPNPIIHHSLSREEYVEKVQKIKNHIQVGDIYEMNFCMEFFAQECSINPFETYLKLNQLSPAPFSGFYRLPDHFLLCASPERFMQKTEDKIICQPIKGTAPRAENPHQDLLLKENLRNNIKEQSENVMIVDLVRNDLSHTAQKNSVVVDELFGIYSFPQVHQMISTISSRMRPDLHFTEVIKNAFPMGSMTGAPKIRAMQLIEEYEITRRGLYSGSIGYITPEADFDFNVVIRSVLFNKQQQTLSFITGSAITSLASPLDEYNECLLKAKAMLRVFE